MKKINLDKRLIDESLRIREEYLNNLKKIKKNDSLFFNIKEELNNTYKILENSDIDKEFIENKILNLNKDVNELQSIIKDVLYKNEILKKDADKLFEIIKEKNPNIKESDLQNFLYPYIKKIDEKFEDLF